MHPLQIQLYATLAALNRNVGGISGRVQEERVKSLKGGHRSEQEKLKEDKSKGIFFWRGGGVRQRTLEAYIYIWRKSPLLPV